MNVNDWVTVIKKDEDYYFNKYLELKQNGFMDYLGLNRGNASKLFNKLGWYERKQEARVLRDKVKYNDWLSEDSSDKWYFVGYFLGDGSLQYRHMHSYRVNVLSHDSEVVDKFAKKFGTELKYSEVDRCFCIDLYSEKVYSQLSELGMLPRKSVEGCVIKVPPKQFYGDYLRGLLDSDGYFKFRKREDRPNTFDYYCEWVGHRSYMIQINDMLHELGILTSVRVHEGLTHVVVSKKEDLQNLYWVLYPEEDCMKLTRKYERFTDFMEHYSNIKSVVHTGEFMEMMDMEVEGEHCFYANGILVSNCAQELRCQTNLANVKNWADAFNSGDDIHKRTAIAMYGEDKYDKHYRKLAKAINFGNLYGMSPFTLSEREHISLEEAEEACNKWWDVVPEIRAYQNYQLKKAQKVGTQYNYFNFPRRLKYWLDSDDPKKKGFGKRTVGNNPIQSTCAIMTQASLVSVCQKLYENPDWKDDCRFFTFVHDEIDSSVVDDRVIEFVNIQRNIQTKQFPGFPVRFDTSCALFRQFGAQFEFDWVLDESPEAMSEWKFGKVIGLTPQTFPNPNWSEELGREYTKEELDAMKQKETVVEEKEEEEVDDYFDYDISEDEDGEDY